MFNPPAEADELMTVLVFKHSWEGLQHVRGFTLSLLKQIVTLVVWNVLKLNCFHPFETFTSCFKNIFIWFEPQILSYLSSNFHHFCPCLTVYVYCILFFLLPSFFICLSPTFLLHFSCISPPSVALFSPSADSLSSLSSSFLYLFFILPSFTNILSSSHHLFSTFAPFLLWTPPCPPVLSPHCSWILWMWRRVHR